LAGKDRRWLSCGRRAALFELNAGASLNNQMPTLKESSRISILSKVPQVTIGFWIIKILATTLGETGGDALSMSLNLGYAVSTAIFAVFFLITGRRRSRLRNCIDFTDFSHVMLFWAAFILTRPLGATLGDTLTKPVDHGGLNLSRFTSSGVIALLMIICIFFNSGQSENDTTPRPA
jgi:uncharacterized membrane-anchored protein